jgi:thiamine phosphate synthase YjbQ (UPF0047 family)
VSVHGGALRLQMHGGALRLQTAGDGSTVDITEGVARWSRRLGTWQQMILIDFDDSPRDRTVLVQVVS